jgi:hypothetical protein
MCICICMIGVGAPLPNEVLLEVTLSKDLQNLPVGDAAAYSDGLAEHVGAAIDARRGKVRI